MNPSAKITKPPNVVKINPALIGAEIIIPRSNKISFNI